MTVSRLLPLCAAALVAAACGSDSNGPTAPDANVAYVRYVNAVPDTSGVDFRYVDAIENSPIFPNVTYRTYTPYQATGAGPRHLKIFINPTAYRSDSSQLIARQFLQDTTITFEPKTYYTLLHAGYAKTANGPKQHIYVIKDVLPTPGPGQVALRVINALFAPATGSTVNVFVTPDTVGSPTTPFTGSATFGGLARVDNNVAVSSYAILSARDTLKAVNTYKLGVQGSASDSLTASTAPALIGASATTAVAGTQVGGTVFTAVLLPRAGTCTKCAAFTTPGILYMVDRAGRQF